MKSKRVGLLSKVTQGSKKKQSKALSTVNSTESQDSKKDMTADCNGVCSIAWKPATAVSR